MNPAVEHTIYRKFHPRLPHFAYNALATDKLTQLYATWHSAVMHSRSIPVRPSTIFKIHDFRRRVDEFHRHRFLRAFAKAHPLPPPKGWFWEFGAAQEYRSSQNSHLKHSLCATYAFSRCWRQHIPNLP